MSFPYHAFIELDHCLRMLLRYALRCHKGSGSCWCYGWTPNKP